MSLIRNLATKISAAAALGLFAAAVTAASASAVPRQAHHDGTTTPIKHVIVIIGENHSFDNVFATYPPPGQQRILNLLSEGIIKTDGSKGPNGKPTFDYCGICDPMQYSSSITTNPALRAESRWRDMRRDSFFASAGIITLRYSWPTS